MPCSVLGGKLVNYQYQATSVSTRLGPLPVRIFGTGRTRILTVHGLLFDGRLWHDVAEILAQDAMVIVVDLPFGAHRTPVPDRSQLTPPRVADALVDILDALEIPHAVLLGNDTGGALCQIAASLHPRRFPALALTSCDSFRNFPPTIFKPVARFSNAPGVAKALLTVFSWAPMLSRPSGINLLAARPIDRELVLDWMRPSSTNPAIRADLVAWMRSLRSRYTMEAAERLRTYPGVAVLAWSRQDRVFPRSHAERLARVLPTSRIVWIDDALTLSPLDQPRAVADAVQFLVDEMQDIATG
jgi:pimeloyl-ACP methyl ester carboxylesterase